MKKGVSGAVRAGPAIASSDRQIHQYDKILKENMEAILPGVMENLLDIHAVYSEELPDDVQHTKERKPDVLKKVIDKNGETFVLHIEFQVTDEPDMVFRMAEYYIMLLRAYRLPVNQYVIYLDKGDPHMEDHIDSRQMNFKYRLINLSAIDYRIFLSAGKPEEKMLSILGNFGDRDRVQIASAIVKEVFASSAGDFAKARHLQQLRILGNLRNLQPEISIIMESVATWWKLERDPCYWKGEQVGMEKGIEKGIQKGIKQGEKKKTLEVVKSLLLNTPLAVSEIARIVNVTDAYVRRVKKSLKAVK